MAGFFGGYSRDNGYSIGYCSADINKVSGNSYGCSNKEIEALFFNQTKMLTKQTGMPKYVSMSKATSLRLKR